MLSAGHTVSVVYVAERFGEDFSESELASQCIAVRKVQFAGVMPTLLQWLGGMSVSLAWCGSTMAKSTIREFSSAADIVWVEHLRGVGMLPFGIQCPIIWDAVDALGPLFDGRAKLVNNPILAVTSREASLIGPDVVAIPNGVDFDYFHPSNDFVKATGPLHISMVGRWNYLPNADGCAQFLRDVWPEVSRVFPDAVCSVIGPGSEPGSLVADAAARSQAAGTILVTGPVPDVRPYIHQSVLTICPATLAAGMQNKILESLACGVPVVCTAIAAEGTLPGGMPGVLQASTPDNMAAAIINLLSDPDAARSLGLQGRDALAETMSWHPSYAKIAALLERVLQT